MSDIRNKIYRVLKEYKSRGKLYHATDLRSLLFILQTDTLRSYRPIGISVSRSSKIGTKFGEGVTLVLDGDKISEKYKIFPFSYDGENAEEEVIQTNKNLPLVWKTPAHNNAFLSLINDTGGTESEFAQEYGDGEGSALPNLHNYLLEIQLSEELYTPENLNLIKKACEKTYGKEGCPEISMMGEKQLDPSKRFLTGPRQGQTSEHGHKLLRSLDKNEKRYLKRSFDNMGFDLPDDVL